MGLSAVDYDPPAQSNGGGRGRKEDNILRGKKRGERHRGGDAEPLHVRYIIHTDHQPDRDGSHRRGREKGREKGMGKDGSGRTGGTETREKKKKNEERWKDRRMERLFVHSTRSKGCSRKLSDPIGGGRERHQDRVSS